MPQPVAVLLLITLFVAFLLLISGNILGALVLLVSCAVSARCCF